MICLIHQSFCDNPLCVLKKGIRHLCIMKRKQGICVVSSLFRFFAMAVFYEKSSCFEILQRRVKSLYCYPIYTNLCFSMFYVSWQPIPNFISFKLKWYEAICCRTGFRYNFSGRISEVIWCPGVYPGFSERLRGWGVGGGEGEIGQPN